MAIKGSGVPTIMIIIDVCLLRVKTAVTKSPITVACAASVATFLTSNKLSTSGIVPIVQSQHKSIGRNSSRRFTAAR